MLTMATSIMSSVGCFVVIFWTQMPGSKTARTRALPRWRAPKRSSS